MSTFNRISDIDINFYSSSKDDFHLPKYFFFFAHVCFQGIFLRQGLKQAKRCVCVCAVEVVGYRCGCSSFGEGAGVCLAGVDSYKKKVTAHLHPAIR